ncbi:two-component sensor histidine kinase [Kordia sp. YSTF-M3]|uniref:histidine kinase n=1 Tax=Kordia aestuariivivens TaxID=2759037 RepID=A0ABR7QEK8_9FLAO|nr:ATP-binding protein [Kordia aestuariivivens]MBC8757006.1 two-component sensor histidine kinase [Kordia aestuariivivens]
MNSLLKRQLRKYLSDDLKQNPELERFLDAVNRSYNTSDEQFIMLQRATAISSEELFLVNEKLKKELDSQKEVIEKLKNVINTLKTYELTNSKQQENIALDSLTLVDLIDNQTKEILQINQQRDKLLTNLERQNQELNNYTHLVSHDLQSPLQSIDALTYWLQSDYEEILDEDGKNTIQLIRGNVEKMDTLVKGILKYSTIGSAEKGFYKVDTHFVVQKVVSTTEIPEHINISIPKKLPVVTGDHFRLEELFRNLINNAIKFNDKPQGEITIGYTDASDFWEFYVKDNGKGIEEKYFEKVFMAFQKLENDYKSSGIGLSIVKKIMDLYEGVIWIESKPTEGTTFYFTLKK